MFEYSDIKKYSGENFGISLGDSVFIRIIASRLSLDLEIKFFELTNDIINRIILQWRDAPNLDYDSKPEDLKKELVDYLNEEILRSQTFIFSRVFKDNE